MKSLFTTITILVAFAFGGANASTSYANCCNDHGGEYNTVQGQNSAGVCHKDDRYTDAELFYDQHCHQGAHSHHSHHVRGAHHTGDITECSACFNNNCYHYNNCAGAHHFGGQDTGNDSECSQCIQDQCYRYTNCLRDYGPDSTNTDDDDNNYYDDDGNYYDDDNNYYDDDNLSD